MIDDNWLEKRCKFDKCYYRQNCIEKSHICAALHNLPENIGKIMTEWIVIAQQTVQCPRCGVVLTTTLLDRRYTCKRCGLNYYKPLAGVLGMREGWYFEDCVSPYKQQEEVVV